MDLGLKDKVALVTAASKGLGYFSALALGLEGAKVIINSSDAGHLAGAASKLTQLGIEVNAIQGDVTDPSEPSVLINSVLEKYGRIDIVVANASGPKLASSMDLTEDEILGAINNNMLSAVRLFKNAMDPMIKNGFGRLISISSYSIVQAIPNLALSNIARKSLAAWIKTAAYDLRHCHANVTINTICPGIHLTDRIKELRSSEANLIAGNPEDFGKAVAFVASTHAGYINGASLVIDGGETLNI